MNKLTKAKFGNWVRPIVRSSSIKCQKNVIKKLLKNHKIYTKVILNEVKNLIFMRVLDSSIHYVHFRMTIFLMFNKEKNTVKFSSTVFYRCNSICIQLYIFILVKLVEQFIQLLSLSFTKILHLGNPLMF
jgi:hypothetical protein